MDDKIIAVCADDPEFRHYNDIKDLPPHRLAEIRRFFEDCIHFYKLLILCYVNRTFVYKIRCFDASIWTLFNLVLRQEEREQRGSGERLPPRGRCHQSYQALNVSLISPKNCAKYDHFFLINPWQMATFLIKLHRGSLIFYRCFTSVQNLSRHGSWRV